MSKVKPITPKEVVSKKQDTIPDEVFEVFNDLITKNWDGHRANFKQDEVARLVEGKLNCTHREIYDNHWLDVEDVYRKAGWKVEYDKPGYNESYDANFTFSKKG